MNNFKLAYRNIFRKKQSTAIKVLSLGVGLAVGLVLLSKVSFERNYDDFYSEGERIYRIETQLVQNEEPQTFGQISGAIAPGMKAEIPGVEAATRFTMLSWEDAVFYTEDKHRHKGSFIMADENFFDLLSRPMIAGNAKEILSLSMHALVSQSLATKIGGEVIGKTLQMESYPGKIITIGGIFKDIPENSSYHYDVIVSLESIGQFMWDGRDNWIGNDRYMGFVKLGKDINPETLMPAIRQMQEKNQPMEDLKKAGVDLTYTLSPLLSVHRKSQEVKTVILILSIIAFTLLLTAVLNYLLIVITSLMARNKEFAVNKCYGASGMNIIRLISAETLLNFFLALLTAIVLLLLFRSAIEEVLGASLLSLISLKAMMLIAIVCLVIIVVSVFFPVGSLRRIPPIAAFRNERHSKQNWKLALLLVQFVSAAFLLLLTLMMSKQYKFMVTDNPGYDYQQVMYLDLSGLSGTAKAGLIAELQRDPAIEYVSLSSTLPLENMSGNNVFVEGNDQELFNIADMYYADENFVPLMGIPVVAGKSFGKEHDFRSALVSESFREKMKTLLGWEDVVGKDVIITEHGLTHIVGVFPDIRIGSIAYQDTRPVVLFYAADNQEIMQHYASNLIVKLKNFNAKNILSINNTVSWLLPDREVSFILYADSIVKSYNSERLFRNAITISAMITMVIALIGLMGYVINEISFRTAEIAIRKINGAMAKEILRLFAVKILAIALPAIIAGSITAHFVGEKLMSNFSVKAGFSIWEYFVYTLGLLIIIEFIVVLNSIKIANQNPVDSLRKD